MNNFFLYLLLIHFINDFIIQNDELVIKKIIEMNLKLIKK